MSHLIEIYTDGASRGNPGPGGYGVVLKSGKHEKRLSGAYRLTTNNRMELLAVIIGLEALKTVDNKVTIYSDSKYVVDSITKGWVFNWIKKTDFGKKKNPDLWQRYLSLHKKHQIQFIWVKGHADNFYNNICDQLATEAADNGPHLVDKGFEKEQTGSSNSLF
ncbi:MAG: ribonuclease HI [Chitinophagales bacterium]|nr:ribonuclease HI [Chitinophagales bacterium]